MTIYDHLLWQKIRNNSFNKNDYFKDWFIFTYFIFIIPALLLMVGLKIQLDEFTISCIITFLIGIIIGFVFIRKEPSQKLIYIMHIFINIFILFILLFLSIYYFKVIYDMYLYFIFCPIFYIGYIIGNRFNYVLWQYEYIKSESRDNRKKFILGKLLNRPLLLFPLVVIFILSPYIFKLIIMNYLEFKGLIIYFLMFLILFLLIFKYLIDRK